MKDRFEEVFCHGFINDMKIFDTVSFNY